MGLLTSPAAQERLPKLFVRYHHALSVATYIGGIVWFLLLAYRPLGVTTYFSENALLPGLVHGHFDAEHDAEAYFRILQGEAEKYPSEVPYPWLLAQFKQLGLDTYTHEFVLKKPFGSKVNITGMNIYAIFRAPRTSGTEALLLSVPYRPPLSIFPNTSAGIAIMLALARFFRKHTYWAKDIIFLITEHEQLGMQAWLDAYHQSDVSSNVLANGDLLGRSGSIQAALNLEIHSRTVNTFDVKIEGLNGQLPNLDYFNLAVRLCRNERFHVTVKGREEKYKSKDFDDWQHNLKTLIAMMKTQATGIPSGNHGLLHRYNIEALTLEGKSIKKKGSEYGFIEMGLLLEGIFRSLNNLLERFHQSYFFYLLVSTSRFVSIGLYMPPFALVAAGILIKALALRIETNQLAEKQAEAENELKATETEWKEEGKGDADRSINSTFRIHVEYGLTSTLPVLILTHTIGVAFYMLPKYLNEAAQYLHIKAEDTIFSGILAFFFASLLVPHFIYMKRNNIIYNWQVLKCVALLELGTLIFAVAFVNFSLAFIMTLIYAPICVGISPSYTRLIRWIKGLPVMLASPLVLLFLFVAYDTASAFPNVSHKNLLVKSYSATKNSVLYSIADNLVYGNWMYPMSCTLLLPVWLQFWIITQVKL